MKDDKHLEKGILLNNLSFVKNKKSQSFKKYIYIFFLLIYL